jgi:hypothetical protein
MQQRAPTRSETYIRETAAPVAVRASSVKQPSPPPDALPRPRRLSSAIWALSGFVLGAVFWHTIGFWSFVNSTLLPGPDARRTEREAAIVEARTTQQGNPRSPLRPTRSGTKTVTKLPDPSHADLLHSELAAAPSAPLVINAMTVADCVTLVRRMQGQGVETGACASSVGPLAEGAGLALADRGLPKAAANAPPLLWQAKVEVTADKH